MSVQALSWVLDNSQSEHAARLVLISIANHCDKFGQNAWPSVASIGSESKLCERIVRAALLELVNLGELKIIRFGGPNRSNLYSLPKMQGAKNAGADYAGAKFPERVQNSAAEGAKFVGAIRKNRPEPSLEPSSVRDYIFGLVKTTLRSHRTHREDGPLNPAAMARQYSKDYGWEIPVSLVEEAIAAAEAIQ